MLVLLAAVPSAGRKSSRSAQTVRQEQQAARRKIDNTKRRINNNLEDTRRELQTLQSIEGDIRLRNAEEGSLREHIGRLRSRNKALADSVAAKEKQIQSLRSSYGRAVRSMRRQRQTASPAAFILSSDSYRQARSRLRYLRQLGQWEKEKSEALTAAVGTLLRQKAALDSSEVLLASSIDSLAVVQRALAEQKHKADAVVGSLKRQSRNLNKILAEQQALAKRLDDELNRIIEEEARQAAEEARRKAEQERRRQSGDTVRRKPATPAPAAPRTPVEVSPSDFAKAKGRLPMPVDGNATIVSTFGRHTHSEYSKVEVQNNGIDIETAAGASARAVYPGTVSMIIVMEGYGNVVLVRHGEYLTVYAGIDSPAVRKGQTVSAGQTLGTIGADGGKARLHFEVRHEKEKLDPALWLR